MIITAEKLLYGGDALARRDDGKTVFIPYAVPGDKIIARICEEKKNYIRAEILEILTPGDGRVTPECRHFGKCGGCSWQHIEYPRQVEAKRLILEELFHHRFPETRNLAITVQPCPRPFGYRSRARVRIQSITNYELGITNCNMLRTRISRQIPHTALYAPHPDIAVGFFRGGSHFVEDIESCPLLRPRLNDALRALRRMSLDLIDARGNDNILEIDIACSEEDETWAIAKIADREKLLRRKVGDFIYNVTTGSFFQANDYMIDTLVSHVMDCVSSSSGAALDLFSGVGLFSLPLARHFNIVTAVEHSRESYGLCAMNAAGARIDNLKTVCCDVVKWLNLQTEPRFDCVVLDPPRAGVGPGVMEHVGRLACNAIVYVSCDPQTLARDIARLDMDRWRIVSINGFDMFPQTYHFETVVHLCRIANEQ